jgi:hypothetical protein
VITGELAMVSVAGVDVAPEHVEFTTVMEAVPALAMRMAGTTAVSCVAETNVVASADPFQFTVDVETKFVPFTVSVNCEPPGVTQVGLIELIVGAALIVNVTAFDVVLPQELELTTVIEAVPAVAMRDAVTVAVSCVEETNAVASGVPFQFTVEPETKFVPVTVNVNCGPPAAAQVGLSELRVGTAPIVITNVCWALVLQGLAPLLAVTVTLVVPAVVGVPEITPVLGLTLRPAGSGLALKLVGLLVAVIV